MREHGVAAEVELGQPCGCCRVPSGCGIERRLRAEQAARRCKGRAAADNRKPTGAMQNARRHGETPTDIRAEVAAVDTVSEPERAPRCRDNWRYTRQAYLARASTQSLPLSCEQAAL